MNSKGGEVGVSWHHVRVLPAVLESFHSSIFHYAKPETIISDMIPQLTGKINIFVNALNDVKNISQDGGTSSKNALNLNILFSSILNIVR